MRESAVLINAFSSREPTGMSNVREQIGEAHRIEINAVASARFSLRPCRRGTLRYQSFAVS